MSFVVVETVKKGELNRFKCYGVHGRDELSLVTDLVQLAA